VVSAAARRWRRRLGALAFVVVALLTLDFLRPPREQWTVRALVAGIRVYRANVSAPLGGLGVRCRFEPSCSRYAEAALLESGAVRGGLRAAGRLLRCGPWTPPGTFDPP
jgi:hypothetical protein